MDSLEEVRDFLANVPFIHAGGCGISALAMIRWCEKNRVPRPNIVYLYHSYDEIEFENNRGTMMGEDEKYSPPAHVCLYDTERGYFDAKRTVDVGDWNIVQHIDIINDVEFLEKTIMEPYPGSSVWNSCFDKLTECPIIEETLGIELPV